MDSDDDMILFQKKMYDDDVDKLVNILLGLLDRNEIWRTENYVEFMIPRYIDYHFCHHFGRETVEILTRIVRNCPENSY